MPSGLPSYPEVWSLPPHPSPSPYFFCTDLSAHKTKRRLDSHRLTFITAFTQSSLCYPAPIKSTRLFSDQSTVQIGLVQLFPPLRLFPLIFISLIRIKIKKKKRNSLNQFLLFRRATSEFWSTGQGWACKYKTKCHFSYWKQNVIMNLKIHWAGIKEKKERWQKKQLHPRPGWTIKQLRRQTSKKKKPKGMIYVILPAAFRWKTFAN